MTLPDPDGAGSQSAPVYSYGYDISSNLTAETDPLGGVTAYSFDALNRVVDVELPDPDGGGSLTSPIHTTVYDLAGRVDSWTDALSRTTSFTYDHMGRMTSRTDPDPDGVCMAVSPVTDFKYDAMSNLISVTDPLDNTTDYTFDNLYRLIEQTLPDPDGAGSLGRPETSYEYDLVGNLTKLTDPVGNETSWTFDNLNRLTLETNELSKTRSYVYDAASNLTSSTDRRGLVKEFTYDDLHRLTQELWKGGSTTVNTIDFAYDSAGMIDTASDDVSSYDYAYDALLRLTSLEADNTGSVMTQLEFDFDAAGNRTALRAAIHNGSSYDDDLENTYTYDALHRLTRLDQAGQSGGNVVAEKRVDFAYNATGQFTDIDRFKDLDGGSTHHVVETDFVYDGLGRLTDLTHTHDTTTIADYGWTFDSYSRVTQMSFTSSTGNSGTSDYSYDDTGQVTAADHDFQTDESYSYDENGNRTVSGYTTGDNNQLTSDGTFNYTYDDEGNRLTRTRISGTADDYTTEYEWDHDNRLTKLTYKNNSDTVTKEIEYGYDLFGRRISKTIDWDGAGSGSAEEVHYVYDGDDILLAFDESGDLTNRYLHGPAVDQILADEQVTSLTSAGDVLWPLVDNLGSVRDIVDSTGAVENHLTYDAFGNVTSETDDTVDHIYAYTGRDRDEESDLQYNRARYYDASVGRWISEDPIAFAAGDSNLTRYVGNFTVGARDPTGLVQVEQIVAVALVAQHPPIRMLFGEGDGDGYFKRLAKMIDGWLEGDRDEGRWLGAQEQQEGLERAIEKARSGRPDTRLKSLDQVDGIDDWEGAPGGRKQRRIESGGRTGQDAANDLNEKGSTWRRRRPSGGPPKGKKGGTNMVLPFSPSEILLDFIDTAIRAKINGRTFTEQSDEDIRQTPWIVPGGFNPRYAPGPQPLRPLGPPIA